MSRQPVKRIQIQKEKCNGCRICELRCSFHHDLVYSPTISRINVYKEEIEGITIPKTCVICGKCIESCPEAAISKNEMTGAIEINEEKCTGCQECVLACPYGVMKIHPIRNVAMTCDLCSGNPQCVKYCPEEALHYMTSKDFLAYKQKEKEDKESGKIKKPPAVQ